MTHDGDVVSSATNGADPDPKTRLRRREAPELRREQLIAATIDSIAVRGYAATTLAHVADGAGLSRGIINFHFESKEKLFVETLQFMAVEYARNWRVAIAAAESGAADKLRALICADFDARICNTRKISTWTAFRAEAASRPAYRKLCWERDEDFLQTIRGFCKSMKKEAGYNYDPAAIASAIYALQEGLWLQLMLENGKVSRQSAMSNALNVIGALFPAHFTPSGKVLTQGAGS